MNLNDLILNNMLKRVKKLIVLILSLIISLFIFNNEKCFAINVSEIKANEILNDLTVINLINNSVNILNDINYSETNSQNDININTIENNIDIEINSTKLELLALNLNTINDNYIDINKNDVNIDININSTNITINNINNNNNESKVNCTPIARNSSEYEISESSSLLLVNSTGLADYLQSEPNKSQSIGCKCVAVIFYYKWCPFSAKSAPHFNALARIYPQFHVLAIDAYGLNSVNMRYGLVGVPSLLFFHNGKIVGKLNESDPTIEGFVNYITQLTGLSPIFSPNITDEDRLGPLLSTPQPKFDYLLLFSWIFCMICFSYMFAKSNLFKTIVETVRKNWREAEAQHQHID